MTHTHSRRPLLATLLLGSALTLSSCAQEDPTLTLALPDATAPNAPLTPTATRVLTGFFDAGMAEKDVALHATTVAPGERFAALRAGEADMTVGCVGEILEELDPTTAAEVREKFAASNRRSGADRVRQRDEAYSHMVAALPSELQASYAGPAIACEDSSLPQNLVAVFREPEVDRERRRVVINVIGGTSEENLRGEGPAPIRNVLTEEVAKQGA